jgi:hypothetical protein
VIAPTRMMGMLSGTWVAPLVGWYSAAYMPESGGWGGRREVVSKVWSSMA